MKTSEIAALCDGKLEGDPDLEIESISDFSTLKSKQLGFVSVSPENGELEKIPADCCLIVPEGFPDSIQTTIHVQNTKFAFAKASARLLQRRPLAGMDKSAQISKEAHCNAKYVGPNVVVEPGATIADGVELHAGTIIGRGVAIGQNSVLHPGVTVYEDVEIGAHCILHSGSVIGAPGFGYVREGDEIIPFPQVGKVIISDYVDIGANTCIDRGSLNDTEIGSFTKIDNLCQIAHNVSIGARVLIAAHVGISGSVVIENDVVIGGQVGIADHVTIRSGAILGARSAVFPGKVVRKGVWAGTPVQPIDRYKEQNALIRSLSRIREDIRSIKNIIK